MALVMQKQLFLNDKYIKISNESEIYLIKF